MNKVFQVGRLTQDPEIRYTTTGKAVSNFTIAVNDGYGENKSVQYIPIVAWEKIAENCGNNLFKGSKVLVEGKLQIRSYDTNDGQKRKVTEVVAQSIEFLDRKREEVLPFSEHVDPNEVIPFGGTYVEPPPV